MKEILFIYHQRKLKIKEFEFANVVIFGLSHVHFSLKIIACIVNAFLFEKNGRPQYDSWPKNITNISL